MRTDPITNTLSIHSKMKGKPMPKITRMLNATPEKDCAFCHLTKNSHKEKEIVYEQDGTAR